MLHALYRMGYKDRQTVHGFRALATTILNDAFVSGEHSFPPEIIEVQHAHSPKDKVRAAYNRNDYLSQRAAMMQWYSDFLERLETQNA